MKSLLDKSNLPKKLLDAVENKSIKTSRYSTFTLNIFGSTDKNVSFLTLNQAIN